MLILKYNELPSKDMFIIERHLVRWLDHKGPKITPEWHVLDLSRTDLYGHLLGIFGHLKVFDTLQVSPSQLLDFLVDVDTAYLHTPYHSFYHAADIVVMLYYILMELDGIKQLDHHQLAPLLIAALCHDMGHPGYNNLYQVNFKTPLAQRYNNTSVLENYSVDITLALLIKHKLFDNVAYEWKQTIKQLILSTDMVYHYELQEKAGALEEIMNQATWTDDDDGEDDDDDDEDDLEDNDHSVYPQEHIDNHRSHRHLQSHGNNDENDNNNDDDDDDDDDSSDTESFGFSEPPTPTVDQTLDQHFNSTRTTMAASPSASASAASTRTPMTSLTPRQRHDFCRIILHAADISNTVRPWLISKQWSDLIVQEFFRQGDAEKLAGLPISPGMDRDESDQATISLKFGDFVVKSYFEALAGILPKSRVFLTTLAENRVEWMQLKDNPMTMALTPPPPPHERHFPSRLLPSFPVPNPPGRRVSVPAGLVIIPDHHWQRQRLIHHRRRHHHLHKHRQRQHQQPHRITKLHWSPPRQPFSTSPSSHHYHHHHRFTVRSASHPIVLPDLIFRHSDATTAMIGASQLTQLIQTQRKNSDNGSTDDSNSVNVIATTP